MGKRKDKRKGWTKEYRKFKHTRIQKLAHKHNVMKLLTDQMAKDEFEKAEYQRTGIQH